MDFYRPSEEWRPIPDCPGYEASDQGRIRCTRPRGRGEVCPEPRVLAPSLGGHGYPMFQAGRDGKRRTIHRAVAVTFGVLDGWDDPRDVDHVDRDRANPKLENLRAVTRSQNNANREVKNWGIRWVEARERFRVRPPAGLTSREFYTADEQSALEIARCLRRMYAEHHDLGEVPLPDVRDIDPEDMAKVSAISLARGKGALLGTGSQRRGKYRVSLFGRHVGEVAGRVQAAMLYDQAVRSLPDRIDGKGVYLPTNAEVWGDDVTAWPED